MSSDTHLDQAHDSAPSNPGAADSSRAAARLLEIAARESEQWKSEARREADTLIEDARSEASRLVEEGREEARRLAAEARVEAGEVREELARDKHRHDTEVAELRGMADSYRDRMRGQLTELLEVLDRREQG